MREPICGRDFCSNCGDCLHCYGSDPCGGEEERGHDFSVLLDTTDGDEGGEG